MQSWLLGLWVCCGECIAQVFKKVHSMYCVISILKIKSLTGIPALNVIPYETLSRS